MKEENYKKTFEDGKTWYRIVAMAKELGVTDQTVRNYIDRKIIIRKTDELGRPWVRLADGYSFNHVTSRPYKDEQ